MFKCKNCKKFMLFQRSKNGLCDRCFTNQVNDDTEVFIQQAILTSIDNCDAETNISTSSSYNSNDSYSNHTTSHGILDGLHSCDSHSSYSSSHEDSSSSSSDCGGCD